MNRFKQLLNLKKTFSFSFKKPTQKVKSYDIQSSDADESAIVIDSRHCLIVANYRSMQRSPYYAFVLFLLSLVALAYSVSTFVSSMKISGSNLFVASTTSDTAVHPVITYKHVVPVEDQEYSPGEVYSESESESIVRDYMISSLKDCFSMNYLNSSTILSKCKSNHLDSETDTQDVFIQLLKKSNYLDIMRKYETSAKLHIDEESIKLKAKAIGSRDMGYGVVRKRAIWIYTIDMHYSMEKVKVTSPSKWEVEMIRESTFNKAFPVSIHKIRDVE